MASLATRKGEYGFDAPYVAVMLAGFGLAWLAVAAVLTFGFRLPQWGVWPAAVAAFQLLSLGSFVYTTRRGKFEVWARILQGLHLKGDETVLDMGSGRGAVLLMAAELVANGQAVGLDLWRSGDQSGNTQQAARRNADRESVGSRVRFESGDMSAMPFPDASFDLVLSSLAIHNIEDAAARQKAIDEAVRVLKPGGRLAIADFRATAGYASRLRELGIKDVARRGLGWRMWYGGPWAATTLVTATKAKG